LQNAVDFFKKLCKMKACIADYLIKRSDRLAKKDLTGLKKFHDDFPEAKCYLLYGGSREEYENGIYILPVEKALKELPDILDNSPH